MTARVAAAAVLVAVTFVAVACGGNSRRNSVASYIDDVNNASVQMEASLTQVAKSKATFATSGAKAAQSHKRAADARAALQRLQAKLRAMEPPADARRLHRQLLALVGAEVGVAREVEGLTTFLPSLNRALAPVPAAQKRLNAGLKASKKPVDQARALERYSAELAAPLAAVRAIDAPAVTVPLRDAQATTLTRVRTSAVALAAALRERRSKAVPRLERNFFAAARSGQALSAQRARIAAVRAYNARIRGLTRLAARVQSERDRLQRTL